MAVADAPTTNAIMSEVNKLPRTLLPAENKSLHAIVENSPASKEGNVQFFEKDKLTNIIIGIMHSDAMKKRNKKGDLVCIGQLFLFQQ